MKNAVRLPVAVSGAPMPDAHQGYGLPIGGVLATENAVIPYAVGVDIACRMKLSVFDIAADQIARLNDTLIRALNRETVFGTGGAHQKPLQHDVLDEDWNATALTTRLFDKARDSSGTSGSGNHFVEFGTLTVSQSESDLNLPAGEYLALLSHSGSRGAGANIADFYSKLAAQPPPRTAAGVELSLVARHGFRSRPGILACHESDGQIRPREPRSDSQEDRESTRRAGDRRRRESPQLRVERNTWWARADRPSQRRNTGRRRRAWCDSRVDGLARICRTRQGRARLARQRITRRGPTDESHRRAEQYRWSHIKPLLEEAGVQLLSAGIDENPHAYKDINVVMSQQADLVDVLARFDPRIVKMADAGEKPED